MLSSILAAPLLALCACAPSGEEDGARPAMIPAYEPAGAHGPASGDTKAESVIELSVTELADLLETGKVRLIDVRTAEEVTEGKIPGAEHIPLAEFDPAKLDLSDGREVILYCRSGRRSGIAAERLAQFTGKPARHLAGGINAWRDAGMPTE